MDPLVHDVVVEALKALFMICLPVVVAVSLSGTLIAALQSVTSIQEPALGYGVRLVALVVVVYFLFANFSNSVLSLAELVYR